MSTQVQFRRGTTLETTNFTGAIGEVTVDTTKNVCVVHDASKAGGYPLMREDGVNSALALGSPANCSLKFVNNPNTGIYSPGVDQVAIATAGVQRLLIDASGNITNPGALTAASFIPTGASVPVNGLYLPGANQVALSTGGTGRLFVGSTGNVGVGTSSPGTRLDVFAGNNASIAQFDTTAANGGGIAFSTSSTVRGNIGAGPNIITGALISDLAIQSNTNILFATGGGAPERLRITSAGLVGIGTTSPVGKVDITGTSVPLILQSTIAASNYFTHKHVTSGDIAYIGNGGGGALTAGTTSDYVIRANLGSLIFACNGDNERARIDSSGRLGIGTTSPSEKLDVSSGTNGTAAVVKIQDPAGRVIQIASPSSSTEAYIGTTTNHRLDFYTNNGIKATLGTAGNINAFATSTDGINSRLSVGAGTTNHFFAGLYSATGTGDGTVSYRVWSNGNVINTNGSYGAISDRELKENIVNATSQWADLKALQVRKYNFKEGQTHTQIGLIAQEVELVSPGLVTESPDRDADGNDLGTVTKSVNYSVLYMKAVKALQEAMERIETLEAKVAALEQS